METILEKYFPNVIGITDEFIEATKQTLFMSV